MAILFLICVGSVMGHVELTGWQRSLLYILVICCYLFDRWQQSPSLLKNDSASGSDNVSVEIIGVDNDGGSTCL